MCHLSRPRQISTGVNPFSGEWHPNGSSLRWKPHMRLQRWPVHILLSLDTAAGVQLSTPGTVECVNGNVKPLIRDRAEQPLWHHYWGGRGERIWGEEKKETKTRTDRSESPLVPVLFSQQCSYTELQHQPPSVRRRSLKYYRLILGRLEDDSGTTQGRLRDDSGPLCPLC